MKLKTLLEEWKDSFKFGKHTYEIFKNPTQKELLAVSNQTKIIGGEMKGMEGEDIRFIIDMVKKDLYVFSALLLHREAAKELEIDLNHWTVEDENRYIYDYGTYRKGKIEVSRYSLDEKNLKDYGRYFSLKT